MAALGGGGVRLGGGELGALGGDLGEDLHLVELGEDLAGVHLGVDVGVELGDDAGGLAFDLDLEDGLDLAGGDDGAGNVAALDFAELRGFEPGVRTAGRHDDTKDHGEDENGEAAPDPEVTFLLWCHGSSPEPRVWV